MPFYTYNQNNSGGSFDYDPKRGITHHVIIEADSENEANKQAESIGLYFDGEGDCHCCGDRWYEASARDATEAPKIYGQPVEKYEGFGKWINGYEAFVHYANGRVVGFLDGKGM